MDALLSMVFVSHNSGFHKSSLASSVFAFHHALKLMPAAARVQLWDESLYIGLGALLRFSINATTRSVVLTIR